MAAEFTFTNGPNERALPRWMAWEKSSLPVLLSPWIRTVVSLRATLRASALTRSRMALVPQYSRRSAWPCPVVLAEFELFLEGREPPCHGEEFVDVAEKDSAHYRDHLSALEDGGAVANHVVALDPLELRDLGHAGLGYHVHARVLDDLGDVTADHVFVAKVEERGVRVIGLEDEPVHVTDEKPLVGMVECLLEHGVVSRRCAGVLR